MNATFPTALLLILVLLVQSVSVVAAALPCTPEGMAAPVGIQMPDEMPHPTHHRDHHPMQHPDAHSIQTDTDDGPDCCEQMSAGACATGGCAAGTGSTMTMPLQALYLSTDPADRHRPVDNTSHYRSPASAIFRPTIS